MTAVVFRGMEAQRLKALFDRHLNEGLNNDQHQELLKLLKADNLGILDEQMKSLWEEALVQQADQEAEKRIRLVMDKVNRPVSTGLVRRLWWAAAAAILLTAFAVLYRPFSKPLPVGERTAHFSTINTGPGMKKMIRLPDGTAVFLNSTSSITYADDYNDSLRKITLKGEAFFQVVKDPGKPFVVEFKGLYTRVLGTSFNINAYPENKAAQVAVATGKVEVGKMKDIAVKGAALAVLVPGKQLDYSFSERKAALFNVDDIAVIGDWKQGVIRFKGEDFGQVALRLEKWYNVKISFENRALRNCRFRGTFKNLSLQKVLGLLQKSSGFNFEINQQQVFIKGKGCL